MTNVLERPPRVQAAGPAARRSEPAAPVWVRGAFAAAWSSALGIASLIVISLIVWTADSRSGANAAAAMRLAAQLWLLAHRTPLQVTDGALTIPPLLLTLMLGLLVARATSIVARASHCTEARELRVVVVSVTLPYAVIASVLAAVTPSATIRPSPGAAFVCAALVGGVFATIGAVRGAGLTGAVWATVPPGLRRSLRAAGSAAVVLIGASTVLALGSLLAHIHRFTTIVNRYHGAPGVLSMLLLSLLLLPNSVVFALGYLVGPGFAIGTGSAVALGGSRLGVMPSLPLLAAVPTGPGSRPLVVCCVVAVAAAGAAAGWQVSRRSTLRLRTQVQGALAAGAGLGVGAAILVGFAGGPAGPGRLRAVGPSPWQVGLAVAGEISAVAVLVVLLIAWTGRLRAAANRHGPL